tara:strand:+ start:692 stop:1870 length:1179 start_codon:yes stop_codon:yes gene_type:complete
MRTITDINIRNKKVLIRVDYNIPLINGKIIDDYRIKASFKTIQYCLSQNCSIVIMSHLGRPNNNEDKYSLFPVFKYLEEYFKDNFIHFSNNCISKESLEISKNMLPNEIHLLENLRYHKEELMNDVSFSKILSQHAEVYICDSFGTSHREHSSNSSILSFFDYKCIGFLMMNEFKYLRNSCLDSKNLTIIIGGAKLSTKLKMIDFFIDNCSNIIIGGAMAFTIFKSMGLNIGSSLVENNMLEECKKIINNFNKSKTNLLLPSDVVCKNKISNEIKVKNINSINNDDIGLDIGPESMLQYEECINSSDCIIWNGPMGMFEDLFFATGTQSLAQSIANVSKQAKTIIGGGDTVAAIKMTHSLNLFTHVSTGGGASLKLLSGEKLEFENSWEIYA